MLSPCLLHVTLTGEKNCKRTFREEDEEKEEEGKKDFYALQFLSD